MKKRNFLLLGLALVATSLSWAQTPIKQVKFGDIQDIRNVGATQYNPGRAIWGDIDNDGLKDLFVIANQGTHLYKQNADGTFSDITAGSSFASLEQPSAEFIDIDNDGYLDLVVVGRELIPADKKPATVIVYKNKKDGTFEEDAALSAQLVAAATAGGNNLGRLIQAVDFDNDGWTDLVICGGRTTAVGGSWSVTYLAKNMGGHFQIQKENVTVGGVTGKNFTELRAGSVHVGDVNKDGYADIIVVGYADGIGYRGYLYINNGDGTFTQSDQVFTGNEGCETIFADINGDGYDDIIEIGNQTGNVFVNKQDLTFDKKTGSELPTGAPSANNQVSISAGDVNNDGLLDIIAIGQGTGLGPGMLFYNKGTTTPSFTEGTSSILNVSGSTTSGLKRGMNIGLVDVNNDGNLDYAIVGVGMSVCKFGFALNELGTDIPKNLAPTAPTFFEVDYTDGKYILNWNVGTDDITDTDALRYNVCAKDKESGMVYMYAPADLTDGRLKVGGAIVPLIKSTSFEWNLPEGDYVFGVQTIDQADAASEFFTSGGDLVGVEKVSKSAVNVFAAGKTIFIENAADFTVTTVSGQVIAKGAGKQSISGLASGVYIVRTADKAVKVLVF